MIFLTAHPIHQCEDLLDLVADDVSPQLKRHAIDKFTVGLVGHTTNFRVARPFVVSIYQRRHDNPTSLFNQATGKLCFR